MVKRLGLLCGLLVMATSGFANYSQCEPQCGSYLSVEALYWKSMHTPIFVARRSQSGDDPNPKNEIFLTGEYDPGVRVRYGCQWCDWFSDLSYLYLSEEERENRDRGNYNRMVIAGAPPDREDDLIIDVVKSSADFRYQNFDWRVGHTLCQGCNFSSFIYANARWARIDFKNFIEGRDNITDTFGNWFKQDAYFNGGGLGLGFGGRYCFCGFSIGGNTGITAMIGETKLKNFSSNNTETNFNGVFLDTPEGWCHILPAFDFRLGIDYAFCLCCMDWLIEVGYELNHYFNALRYASWNQVSTAGNSRLPFFEVQDVGFAGPYFNLTLRF